MFENSALMRQQAYNLYKEWLDAAVIKKRKNAEAEVARGVEFEARTKWEQAQADYFKLMREEESPVEGAR